MTNTTETDVRKNLEQLICKIRNQVQLGFDQKTIIPVPEEVTRLRVKDFEYGEDGLSKVNWTYEVSERQSWDNAVNTIYGVIKKSQEYTAAFETCGKLWHGRWDLSNGFRFFILHIIEKLISRSPDIEKQLGDLVANCVKELKQEQLRYKATIHLGGLICPKTLKFESNDLEIEIRPVCPKDMEKEVVHATAPMQALSLTNAPTWRTPSAVLHFGGLAPDTNHALLNMWKAKCVLRLFRLGSVEFIRSSIDGEWFMDLGTNATHFTLEHFGGTNKYRLGEDDLDGLKRFWAALWDSIPEEFYWKPEKETYSYQTVAYHRYNDGLDHDSVVERRIASAVMGLESLFLRGSGEQGELSYRLQMRVGKLLGPLSGNPTTVRQTLQDAYKVRSKFVHGDQLSSSLKGKLCTEYGDIPKLATKVLDYLREAVIISLLSKKRKKELISLLDDALIDDRQRDAVQEELRVYRALLKGESG